MSNKTLLKLGAVFVVLALVLVFLGVNYVPRIYASSSAQRNVVVAIDQSYILHSHYNTVQYQQTIAPQVSGYERHLMSNYAPSTAVSGYQRHFISDYKP